MLFSLTIFTLLILLPIDTCVRTCSVTLQKQQISRLTVIVFLYTRIYNRHRRKLYFSTQIKDFIIHCSRLPYRHISNRKSGVTFRLALNIFIRIFANVFVSRYERRNMILLTSGDIIMIKFRYEN